MTTECIAKQRHFQPLGSRQIRGSFDGGRITSDGGALLLRETERVVGAIRQFAACFTDHRDPRLTEHSVDELVAQRVYALACGYEDLNDHDALRHDPMMAVLGALVRVTVRKIWVSWSQSCPYQQIFAQVHARLRRLQPLYRRC